MLLASEKTWTIAAGIRGPANLCAQFQARHQNSMHFSPLRGRFAWSRFFHGRKVHAIGEQKNSSGNGNGNGNGNGRRCGCGNGNGSGSGNGNTEGEQNLKRPKSVTSRAGREVFLEITRTFQVYGSVFPGRILRKVGKCVLFDTQRSSLGNLWQSCGYMTGLQPLAYRRIAFRDDNCRRGDSPG